MSRRQAVIFVHERKIKLSPFSFVLVMDESLSGLDDNLKFQIIPFLKNACETFRIPYIFISHSLTEMRIMTDRVLHVADGRMAGQMTSEELARVSIGDSGAAYTNFLKLKEPRRLDSMVAYRWGEGELFIAGSSGSQEALYELSSTDIMLFRRNPEAISARNLLKCQVVEMFETGGRIGVELVCGSDRLVAMVVRESVQDLEIKVGMELYAAIKATAFKQLG